MRGERRRQELELDVVPRVLLRDEIQRGKDRVPADHHPDTLEVEVGHFEGRGLHRHTFKDQ